MPAEVYGARYRFLPKPELLSFEEIERLARIFVELGVEKLRITGGEPLLRADLPELVRRLAAIPGQRDLTLTTNGVLLAGQAEALARAGLRRASVSLDSHDAAVFREMSGGRSAPGSVLAGIEAARRAGLAPIKVNCVVQRGVNDAGVVELARRFRGTGIVLRFIEFMDVGTLNGWDLSHVVTAREVLARIDAEFPLEPVERGYRGEVASRYRYRDGGGEIGLIASVSEPFCGDCTRARLTTDGKLVTCLFAAGGADLRGPLRAGESDAALRERIAAVWRGRTDRYSEERAAQTDPASARGARPRLEMYQIGG
jgi:cyclic pyranopterin phosphate synthase